MSSHKVFKSDEIDKYEFEKLPKGCMFGLVMNPYNGNVFIQLEKHASTTAISLNLLREILSACDVLERSGSLDPLRDFIECCESGEFEAMREGAEIVCEPETEGGSRFVLLSLSDGLQKEKAEKAKKVS